MVNGNLHDLDCSQLTIGTGGVIQVLAAVCCGKFPKKTSDDGEDDLLGSISLDCDDKNENIISFNQIINNSRCECKCHAKMYSKSDSESD